MTEIKRITRCLILCASALWLLAATPGDLPENPAVGATPALTGKQLTELQWALWSLGFLKDHRPGVYDGATDVAVAAYRRDWDVPTATPVDTAFVEAVVGRANATRLVRGLETARTDQIAAARKALLADPATRDLVDGSVQPADPTRNSDACFAHATVRCLLIEARESAKAVSNPQRRDWALSEILAVELRAGLSRSAYRTLRRIGDPRRILRILQTRQTTLAMERSDAPRYRAIAEIEAAATEPDIARALLRFETATNTIASINPPHWRAYPLFRFALARVALADRQLRDQPVDADRVLTAVRAAVDRVFEPRFVAQAQAALAGLLERHGGEPEPVRAESDRALATVGSRLVRIWTETDIALHARALGDVDNANRYFTRALRATEDHRTPWTRARAAARLADTLLVMAGGPSLSSDTSSGGAGPPDLDETVKQGP